MIAPEIFDQAIARYDLVGTQEQEGDERTLSRPTESDRLVVEPRFERAEQTELERAVARHRRVTGSSSPGSILPPREKSSNKGGTMSMHPWTMHEVAMAQDEARLLRAMAAYKALRGADGGAFESAVESRSGRIRLLDRLLRREVGVVRTPARPAV
jgi:hypothetical protein